MIDTTTTQLAEYLVLVITGGCGWTVRKGGPVSLMAHDQVLKGGSCDSLQHFTLTPSRHWRHIGGCDADDRFLSGNPHAKAGLGDPIGNVFVMLITNRKDSGKRDDGLTAVGSFLQRDE